MKRTIPTRLAGLVAMAAIAAAACASDTTSAIDSPTDSTTTTTSSTVSTTTTVGTTITTSAPTEPETVELAAVMIDVIGVASVAPADWTQETPGVFGDPEVGLLQFGAVRTWLAPNPVLFGLEPLERLQVGDRWWDILGAETPEAAVIVAVTGDELMQYTVELVVPPAAADHYIDAVAMPALEAFEVIDPTMHAGELEAASVAVDGRSVAYATGGTGDATVVFESGWADGMAVWAAVGEDVAGFAKVFAYDRPGNGRSDLSDQPRDGAQIVEELRTTLDVTGHEPPYVLVGHSAGGFYMELFARTYPDEVAGLVLVDSSVVGQTEGCIAELGASECDPFSEDMLDELPEPGRGEGIGFAVTEDQLRAAPPLGPMPAVVLAAEQSEGIPAHDEWWVEFSRERATALEATFVVAEDASHFLQNDRPDLVLQAIEDVIESAQVR